jgi:hypothetical protein
MKRLISLLLFLTLCCAVQANARMNAYIAGSVVAGGGSCTTGTDKFLWSADQTDSAGSSVTWKAQKFTIAAQKSVTMYQIGQCDDNADTGNARIVIMNHDAVNDYPDETSEVSNSAMTKAANLIQACSTHTLEDYELAATLTLPAGTYWLVSQEQNSADLNTGYSTAATGERVCYSSDSGSNWSCVDNTAYHMEVWGCD